MSGGFASAWCLDRPISEPCLCCGRSDPCRTSTCYTVAQPLAILTWCLQQRTPGKKPTTWKKKAHQRYAKRKHIPQPNQPHINPYPPHDSLIRPHLLLSRNGLVWRNPLVQKGVPPPFLSSPIPILGREPHLLVILQVVLREAAALSAALPSPRLLFFLGYQCPSFCRLRLILPSERRRPVLSRRPRARSRCPVEAIEYAAAPPTVSNLEALHLDILAHSGSCYRIFAGMCRDSRSRRRMVCSARGRRSGRVLSVSENAV
jgi:hypothetical protein